MKNAFKVIVTMLITFAVVALMLPGVVSAAASSTPVYPTSIAGFPVVLVKTSANDIDLPNGQTILVLLNNSSTTSTTPGPAIYNYLKTNPLPNNVSYEVYGGPGVTAEQIISLQKQYNDQQKKYGVIKLGSAHTGISPDTASNHGFQVDWNNDPLTQTLEQQSCNIVAPTITGNWMDPDGYAYFGDNVMTNALDPFDISSHYFLQSGLYWGYSNQNYLVWADDSTYPPLAAQVFSMPYIGGDTYSCSVFYDGPNSNGLQEWEMCCVNCTTSDSAYYIEPNAVGTSLYYTQGTNDTSVFFENANTNSNWYKGFSGGTVQASFAMEGIGSGQNGFTYKPWSSDYLNANVAMKGSLANYGTTTWTLSKIPLAY